METALRTALVAWLAADPTLAARLNAVTEEAPLRATLPWLGIASSASSDASTKTEAGREVRVALELQCRGDRPDAAATLVAAIEARVSALDPAQAGFRIVAQQFLRGRAEARAGNVRAVLLEYRFRLIAG